VGAFHYNRLNTVTIGNGVVTIGNWAFAAGNLTSVIIPDSVTIGDSAFYYSDLTTITIGNDVTIGGYNALGTYNEKFRLTYNYVEGKRAGTYVWLGTGWVPQY